MQTNEMACIFKYITECIISGGESTTSHSKIRANQQTGAIIFKQ